MSARLSQALARARAVALAVYARYARPITVAENIAWTIRLRADARVTVETARAIHRDAVEQRHRLDSARLNRLSGASANHSVKAS
jgi:hypothetical protein